MLRWFMVRFSAFLADPAGVPTLAAACVTACMGLALGFSWVPWAVALALVALIVMSPPGPQHPVPA